MPLLSKARSVLVLTSGQFAEELPTGVALAARLKMQGIAAEARSVKSGDSEGPALARAAAEAGCDLLVMGGYGHSRLREMILGGLTRYMLSSAPIPVLMAH
jgi:nucleotide-binding universal stress UspA family protein